MSAPTMAAKLRRLLRRNRRLAVAGAIAGVFVALAVNVAIHDGAGVLLVLVLSGLGCAAAMAIPAGISGASAARHSLRTEQEIAAIEARRRREVSR